MSIQKSHPVTDSHQVYRPRARTEDLVTTETKDEILVYDQILHHIHHLDQEVTTVWGLCDGTRTITDIARDAPLNPSLVAYTLQELEKASLLISPAPIGKQMKESRRNFMRKLGIASVPAIVSISAPIAKAAASCPPLPEAAGPGSCLYDCHCGLQSCYEAIVEIGHLGYCSS